MPNEWRHASTVQSDVRSTILFLSSMRLWYRHDMQRQIDVRSGWQHHNDRSVQITGPRSLFLLSSLPGLPDMAPLKRKAFGTPDVRLLVVLTMCTTTTTADAAALMIGVSTAWPALPSLYGGSSDRPKAGQLCLCRLSCTANAPRPGPAPDT